ncbi:MAG: YmfQ family protein [Firmicutes bacterium]|nr:YmfQ family protein [Bacillota bacterium]
MEYLPPYYRTSRVMTAIQNVIANEIGLLRQVLFSVLDQFFVDRATWGLEIWEKELGIPVDPTKPDDFRRSVIKSKIRGVGTATVDLIKQVAAAFSGGEVDVIEYPAEYCFVVKFIGTRGIPPNLNDLTDSIEQVKPAHLVFSYAYTYLVWQEALTYIWTEASGMTWDQFRVAKPNTQ